MVFQFAEKSFNSNFFQDSPGDLPLYLNFHLTQQMLDLKNYIYLFIIIIIKNVVVTNILNVKWKIVREKKDTLNEIFNSFLKLSCVLLIVCIFFAILSIYSTRFQLHFIWYREIFSSISFLGLGFVMISLFVKYSYDNVFVKVLNKWNKGNE